jgi:CRP-like cAMP-binding protein
MDKQKYNMNKIIQKIEAFKGLDIAEIPSILGMCHLQSYKANHRIYSEGEMSRDMLILLQGELVVASKSGEVLGKIPSGASTGEMGLFTKRPRSANVTAVVDSSCLILPRDELFRLLEATPNLYIKMLHNILNEVCDRLTETGVHLEEYANKIGVMEDERESDLREDENTSEEVDHE